jgi:YD repeat-containing protein
VRFDFDGDLKADIGRWHATTTEFKVKNSFNGTFTTNTIGTTTGRSCPADFDADGKTDPAVFSSGTWKIKKSSNGTIQTITGFGLAGDIPLPGNYRGSTAIDAAVFRPSNNTWYFRDGATGALTSQVWGAAGDIPVPGNYNGDALTDVAVYRPTTGVWYIVLNGGGNLTYTWGTGSDIPVPADYDADNKTDVAVYRRTSGTWYVIRSFNAEIITQGWGNYGDQPTPADYDGDGKADFSIWRPTTGKFHTLKSLTLSFDVQTLGVAGDTAVPSSYIKQIGGTVSPSQLASERLSPKNATGGTDLYSRNFAWGTSLAGLPGRAGMNAGFGIGYNSLVWTKSGSEIYFDTDAGNVSPGFRIGFPTIEPAYYDSVKGAFAYLMVTPSGGRVEFRQVAATGIYETADSSYAKLLTSGAANPNDPVENITITVTSTDGTQMKYLWKGGAFRCTEIKDRNGNYITLVYDDYGLLQTMTDTLGRIVTVVYDASLYPVTVKQSWQNGDHNYATFAYTNVTVNTNFTTPITSVIGPPNGTVIRALEKITYADLSYTKFTYNSYGQVWKVQNFAADNHELNYVRTNLETPGTSNADCPRLGQSISWVENFNGGTPITVTNTLTASQPYSVGGLTGTGARIDVTMTGHPDGLYSRTFVGETGWKEGLPLATEDCIGANCADRKRWTWTDYTQDNIALLYILNPRVKEARVGDSANVKKTAVEYHMSGSSTTVANYGLVKKVEVFDSGLSTVIKKVETDYLLTKGYTDRNIIGLPSETRAWGKNDLTNNLEQVSRVTYGYDEGTFSQEPNQIIAPTRHDTANYGPAFTKRGNPTSTTRHDVTGQTSAVNSQVRYDIAGSPVAQIDPLGRKVRIGYADNFQPTQTFTTFAYPTVITDPAGSSLGDTLHSSTVKYRYDIGANVEAVSPAPAGNTLGKKTTRLFDTYGRLEKETIVNSGAYTRYEYPTNGIQSKVFSTIVDTNANGADALDEVMSESWSDGAGRVRRSRTPHTFDSGGNAITWAGSVVEYDILGRVKRQSVPTEISVPDVNNPDTWAPAGDDATRGWLWTYQKYDWKGRVVRKINTDGTDSPVLNDSDVLITYEGCGCAGGQVTTIQSENVPRDDQPTVNARRTQKVYEDILGRSWKTEAYNWDGIQVYSSATKSFNGLDQPVTVRSFKGVAVLNNEHQTNTMTYDGHGRLKTRHLPQQDVGAVTTFNYNNANDSLSSITDARGAVTNLTYNNQGLLEGKSSSVPPGSGIVDPSDVTFSYDNLGNRTAMTDGFGSQSYSYDSLSRMTSETRTINGVGTYTLNYGYGLNQLSSIGFSGEPSRTVGYNYDKTGRLTQVSGAGMGGVYVYADQFAFRAFGGLKTLRYGSNDTLTQNFNNRLQLSTYQVTNAAQNTFEYYSDGLLKYVGNSINPSFDRLNRYDHAGRLTVGLTGAEARGQAPGPNDLYKQTIQYNAFNDLQGRTSQLWTGPWDSDSATYTNHRRPGWTYDADGRNTQSDTLSSMFNADGKNIQVTDTEDFFGVTQDYDGNGQKIKHFQNEQKYYIRSSVLGGAVIAELNRVGSTNEYRKDVYVYANGERIAVQMDYINFPANSQIRWLYENPVTGSLRGNLVWSELDLFGTDVGQFNQPPPQEYVGSGILYPVNGDPTDLTGGCTMDGSPVSCSQAYNMLGMGAADEVVPASAFYTIRNRNTGRVLSRGAFLLNTGVGTGMVLASAVDGLGMINGSYGFNGQQIAGATSVSGRVNWSSLFGSLFSGTLDVVDTGDTSRVTSWGGDSSAAWVNIALSDASMSGMDDCKPGQPCPKAKPQEAAGKASTCGVNPLTGDPGVNSTASGIEGEVRPGVRGGGFFNSSRPANRSGIHGATDFSFGTNSVEATILGSAQNGMKQFLHRSSTLSILDGRIVSAGYNGAKSLGYYVEINHGGGYTSVYGHFGMDSSGFLKSGRPIGQGNHIGIGGQSGNAQGQPQTEAHLHLIVRKNGVAIDPIAFLNSPCPPGLGVY